MLPFLKEDLIFLYIYRCIKNNTKIIDSKTEFFKIASCNTSLLAKSSSDSIKGRDLGIVRNDVKQPL